MNTNICSFSHFQKQETVSSVAVIDKKEKESSRQILYSMGIFRFTWFTFPLLDINFKDEPVTQFDFPVVKVTFRDDGAIKLMANKFLCEMLMYCFLS